MKKTNVRFRKNNGKFARRYEGISFWFAWVFLLIIAYAVACKVTTKPLISPLVLNPVTQVMAKEPEFIPCEKDVANFLECEVIAGRITEKQAKIMLAIGKAESGLRETAKNKKSSARGVFQIIAGTWYSNDCVGDKYFWKDNTICALKIMKSSGFYPWEVYNTGAYKKFLIK